MSAASFLILSVILSGAVGYWSRSWGWKGLSILVLVLSVLIWRIEHP
jgi:hypothetical protein